MKGWQFLFFIFLPLAVITAVVFYLFEPGKDTPPQTLRCYVAFSDQNAIPFLLREDVQPHAVTLTFQSTSSIFSFTADDLRKGKNWIPFADFPEEEFALTAISPGYETLETLMVHRNGVLYPSPNKTIDRRVKLGEDFLRLNMDRIMQASPDQ